MLEKASMSLWSLIVLVLAAVVPLTGCVASRPATVTDRGLVILLPGVANSRLVMAGLARRVREQYPVYEVRIHIWGQPLCSLRNLAALEQNRTAAAALADEIATYHRNQPDGDINLVGYSGGGAVAVLTVAMLPDDVHIDRLLLVAAAIAPDFPITEQVLPHVDQYVINYASKLDATVSLGTRLAGTIDRKYVASAGSVGFTAADPHLLQVFWSRRMLSALHFGTHSSYLSPLWQKRYLVPLLDPASGLEQARELLIIEQ